MLCLDPVAGHVRAELLRDPLLEEVVHVEQKRLGSRCPDVAPQRELSEKEIREADDGLVMAFHRCGVPSRHPVDVANRCDDLVELCELCA